MDRRDYTWGVLWELVRIHRLYTNLGITPRACRALMGENVKIGPNVKNIVLGTGFESLVPDLGKAERVARVGDLNCILYYSSD